MENRERLEEGERDVSTAKDSNAPAGTEKTPRAKDGKFAKAGEAEKPEGEKAAPAGGLASLQRAVNEGRIDEALRAIGLDEKGPTSKQWEAFNLQSKRAKAAIEKRAQEVAQREQQLTQIVGNLEQQYGRFRAAAQAYQAGDLERAAQLAFGEGFDAINQKAIRQMATRDPEVAQLRAELEQRDRQQAERERQAQEQARVAHVERQREGYVRNLAADLSSLEDSRITAAVEVEPDFVRRVFAVQAKHYDARTDETIPTAEAAEIALAELEAEYQRRTRIFGGASAAAPGVGGAKSAPRQGPSGRVSPVKPKTQLRTREGTEAHAEPRLTGKALMDKYVRQAIAGREQELAAMAENGEF